MPLITDLDVHEEGSSNFNFGMDAAGGGGHRSPLDSPTGGGGGGSLCGSAARLGTGEMAPAANAAAATATIDSDAASGARLPLLSMRTPHAGSRSSSGSSSAAEGLLYNASAVEVAPSPHSSPFSSSDWVGMGRSGNGSGGGGGTPATMISSATGALVAASAVAAAAAAARQGRVALPGVPSTTAFRVPVLPRAGSSSSLSSSAGGAAAQWSPLAAVYSLSSPRTASTPGTALLPAAGVVSAPSSSVQLQHQTGSSGGGATSLASMMSGDAQLQLQCAASAVAAVAGKRKGDADAALLSRGGGSELNALNYQQYAAAAAAAAAAALPLSRSRSPEAASGTPSSSSSSRDLEYSASSPLAAAGATATASTSSSAQSQSRATKKARKGGAGSSSGGSSNNSDLYGVAAGGEGGDDYLLLTPQSVAPQSAMQADGLTVVTALKPTSTTVAAAATSSPACATPLLPLPSPKGATGTPSPSFSPSSRGSGSTAARGNAGQATSSSAAATASTTASVRKAAAGGGGGGGSSSRKMIVAPLSTTTTTVHAAHAPPSTSAAAGVAEAVAAATTAAAAVVETQAFREVVDVLSASLPSLLLAHAGATSGDLGTDGSSQTDAAASGSSSSVGAAGVVPRLRVPEWAAPKLKLGGGSGVGGAPKLKLGGPPPLLDAEPRAVSPRPAVPVLVVIGFPSSAPAAVGEANFNLNSGAVLAEVAKSSSAAAPSSSVTSAAAAEEVGSIRSGTSSQQPHILKVPTHLCIAAAGDSFPRAHAAVAATGGKAAAANTASGSDAIVASAASALAFGPNFNLSAGTASGSTTSHYFNLSTGLPVSTWSFPSLSALTGAADEAFDSGDLECAATEYSLHFEARSGAPLQRESGDADEAAAAAMAAGYVAPRRPGTSFPWTNGGGGGGGGHLGISPHLAVYDNTSEGGAPNFNVMDSSSSSSSWHPTSTSWTGEAGGGGTTLVLSHPTPSPSSRSSRRLVQLYAAAPPPPPAVSYEVEVAEGRSAPSPSGTRGDAALGTALVISSAPGVGLVPLGVTPSGPLAHLSTARHGVSGSRASAFFSGRFPATTVLCLLSGGSDALADAAAGAPAVPLLDALMGPARAAATAARLRLASAAHGSAAAQLPLHETWAKGGNRAGIIDDVLTEVMYAHPVCGDVCGAFDPLVETLRVLSGSLLLAPTATIVLVGRRAAGTPNFNLGTGAGSSTRARDAVDALTCAIALWDDLAQVAICRAVGSEAYQLQLGVGERGDSWATNTLPCLISTLGHRFVVDEVRISAVGGGAEEQQGGGGSGSSGKASKGSSSSSSKSSPLCVSPAGEGHVLIQVSVRRVDVLYSTH